MNTGRKGGGGSDTPKVAPASRKLASGFIAGLRCGEAVRGRFESGPIWGTIAAFVHSVPDHRRGGIKRNSGYLSGYQGLFTGTIAIQNKRIAAICY